MSQQKLLDPCKARSEPCTLTWCALLVWTAAPITPENHPKPSDMPTAAPEPVPPAATTKSYEEIILILKSLPAKKLKGSRLEVNSEYFGTEWAASDDCKEPRCVGIIDKWKTQNAVLMVKWDGWSTNRQTPLDSLDTDADGMSLKLKLLPYANGDAPPELVEEDEQQPQDIYKQGFLAFPGLRSGALDQHVGKRGTLRIGTS